MLALVVIPSHSYALLEIEDSQILGNPTLNAHGSITSVTGGGLHEDGVGTWIDGRFKETDCLVDPGLCTDGFSLAGKFKFDPVVVNYTDARYVLDTGAHGGSSRGVSMYLKGGKLHFQLTTSAKTWTVRSSDSFCRDHSCVSRIYTHFYLNEHNRYSPSKHLAFATCPAKTARFEGHSQIRNL